WSRTYRLFQLPEASDALYQLVDPYRRAYFFARDLPKQELDEMMDIALADLEQLAQQAQSAQSTRKGKSKPAATSIQDDTVGTGLVPVRECASALDITFLVDYLERNLQVWDSLPTSSLQAQTVNFRDSLRRYSDSKRPARQCCYCSSSLP